MRALKLVTSFLILGLILVAVPAMAYPTLAGQVKTGDGYGPYQTGSGGEFTLEALSYNTFQVLNNGYVDKLTKNVLGTTNTFQTFCLEGSEYIYANNTTYNVQISNSAFNGGVGTAGDPISLGTAWLYREFATGGLGDYGYGYTNPGRSGGLSTSAGLLQNAFWMLEGEIAYNAANPFIISMLGINSWSKEDALSNANGAYGVGVLNMKLLGGERAQDQLVLASPVPEPASLLLLGISLIFTAIAIKKLYQVKA